MHLCFSLSLGSCFFRFSLGKLRSITSTRPTSTPEEVRLDNQWRVELADLCMRPAEYGVSSAEPIHLSMQVGMDETPLQYQARVKKTYVTDKGPGELQQVRGQGGDKRAITGTPVTNRLGTLLLFQLIFKWKTSRGTPPILPSHHPSLYTNYSASKYQITSM